jgi:biopolymer transport protein ExbD
MNFQRGEAKEAPEINLIPMIDVLLVILIFLMITTTYSKFAGLEINLPTADAAATPEQPNEINVTVTAAGEILVNRAQVGARDVGSIANALRRAAAESKEPLVVINADAKATHQSVIDVMQAAQQAALPRISFATQSPPNR